MENNGLKENGIINGETGNPTEPNAKPALDQARGYVNINEEGWVTATVHLSKGLYGIIGFLAEVQDIVRQQMSAAIRREKDKELIKPKGFRGFNLFKSK